MPLVIVFEKLFFITRYYVNMHLIAYCYNKLYIIINQLINVFKISKMNIDNSEPIETKALWAP